MTTDDNERQIVTAQQSISRKALSVSENPRKVLLTLYGWANGALLHELETQGLTLEGDAIVTVRVEGQARHA